MNVLNETRNSALEAFRAALRRKQMVEKYMREGKPLAELEGMGIKFWHIPASC